MPITLAAPNGGTLTLAAPLLAAAGGFGDLVAVRPEWLAGVGAVVTRTVGLRAAGGRARIAETVAGVLTPRPGPIGALERALRSAQPVWAALPVPVIVSVWAENAAGYATLAHELAPLPNVAALELNLLDAAGAAETPSRVARAIELASAAGLPLIAKLSQWADAAGCAVAAEDAGAASLALGHGWPAAFVDGTPAFLCGPAIGALTTASLTDLSAATRLPIIAAGGVASAADARRLLAAGASAVAIGAALLRDPSLAARIAADLAAAVP